MKNLFLPLAIMFFTMSSFTSHSVKNEVFNDDCAASAWDAASRWCANRTGGCSDYQLWFFTDVAYGICVANQQ